VKQDAPHSRLLNEAAKNSLATIGMFRKGRSRTWLDDRRWWISIVEFQPSSWSKGSYLNVGAMWLWCDKDCLSYDFGGRLKEFVSYKDEKQFAYEASRLASIARDRVLEQRERFRSYDDVIRYLAGEKLPKSQWHMFHMGIAYGCAGDLESSQNMFAQLSRSKAESEWQKDLVQRAQHLVGLTASLVEFRKYVEESISKTRRSLKLPNIDSLGIN